MIMTKTVSLVSLGIFEKEHCDAHLLGSSRCETVINKWMFILKFKFANGEHIPSHFQKHLSLLDHQRNSNSKQYNVFGEFQQANN